MNNVPLNRYFTFHVSIHQLMDVCFLFSFFYFLVIMSNAAMNIYVQIFVWMYVLISLRYIPRSRVAESCVVTPCLTLWELSNVFQSSCTILHFHQQNINFPTSPQPHQHLLSFVIYIYIYIHTYIHTYMASIVILVGVKSSLIMLLIVFP